MRRAIFPITLAAILAMAGLALAQAPPAAQVGQQNATERSITGTIESADADLLVINSDTGRMYFVLEATTEKPAMLNRGDRVEVFYRPGDDGERDVALRIVAEEPEAVVAEEPPVTDEPLPADERVEARDDALPRTASRVPLLGLLGAFSLLGAAGLSLAARS
jgi:hypothetical protein